MHQRKYQWIKVIVLTWLIAVWAAFWPAQDSLGQSDGRINANANRIDGINQFSLDPDAGPMAIYALQSCFEVLGFNYSYSRFAGISGAAFKFVYDTTEAYESLRDLFPVDVLRSAAVQMGFERAHWETGRSIDEIMGIIKEEIDAGRPLIAPDLRTGPYHDGFLIIAGYDLETRYLLIQGATRKAGYDSIPIPEGWDGPTASPMGWASNPVFVFERQFRGRGDARAGRNSPSIAAAIEIMKGGTLEYGKHPGEEPYLGKAGPHTAGYGLKALQLLSYDIAHRPLVTIEDGEPHLDFGFMWRIDSQIGQLQHDRTHAITFLRQLGSGLPPERNGLLRELADNFQGVSVDARALREVFWRVMPPDVATADAAVAYARGSSSLVLMLPARAGVITGLKSMGEPVFETAWGWVIVADSPEKRLEARLLARAIVSRERNSIRILEKLLPDVDTRMEQGAREGRQGFRGKQ